MTYKKINQIGKHSQLLILLGDQVLYWLGSGRVISLLELVSSFHHKTANKDSPYSVLHTYRPL